ncbi:tetratricopeptide repeat protein [Actinophytocola glycyrrhizae]|uniref:Tetratricopeptide repeat protein n=1 Tax=Actinophytocola glycyrrhizae TaxID=2044873 RepID=A0ABV9RWT3_9PSEU
MSEVVQTALQRGVALLDLGRAREAETHLRTALTTDPGDPMTITLLADAMRRQQRYDEAVETGRSALAADPGYVPAYSVLTASLAGQERYPEAHDVIRRGLALAPEAAALHLQEAGVLLGLERDTEALASIDRAVRFDPENAEAHAVRAATHVRLRRYDEATAAVDEALRLDPENAEAHRVRGVIALHRGGGKEAVAAHRAALRLDPNDSYSRDGLSTALKTRNPLYGWLLRFGLWLDTLPKGVRIAVLLAPFVLTRVLRPYEDQAWATVLIVVVAALALLSWTLEPLMNCVLLLGRDRHLLTRDAKRATYGFLVFAVAAVACVVTGPAQLTAVAFGFGLWAMATGTAHLLDPGPRKVVGIGAAAAALVGAMAVAAVLVAAPGATVAVAVLLLTGVAALWFSAFS